MTVLYALAALIAKLSPTPPATPNGDPDALVTSIDPQLSLAELGLDSLDTIRLVCQIEEYFGVQLDEEGLMSVETVGELAQLVEQARASRPAQAAHTMQVAR